MDDNVKDLCPYCKKTIGEEDNLKVCPICGVHHHLECWNRNDGCSTFMCRGDKPEKKIICKKCGTELEENQRFCPTCGVSVTQMNENICDNCGSKMSESQLYCPVCGKRKTVGELIPTSDSPIEAPTQPLKSGEKKDYTAIIVTVVIFAIVGVVLFFIIKGCVSSGKSDLFKSAYSKYCSSEWCELASDGSYLKVDTNPEDIDNDDASAAQLLLQLNRSKNIEKINKELGLPDSLYKKMEETRALDGRQTDVYENIKVSWSYHPDQGLSVIYEQK